LLKKIYKMGCLEGRGVPVLCIGRTVPKGYAMHDYNVLIFGGCCFRANEHGRYDHSTVSLGLSQLLDTTHGQIL
jgi:hypothetical protein